MKKTFFIILFLISAYTFSQTEVSDESILLEKAYTYLEALNGNDINSLPTETDKQSIKDEEDLKPYCILKQQKLLRILQRLIQILKN